MLDFSSGTPVAEPGIDEDDHGACFHWLTVPALAQEKRAGGRGAMPSALFA